MRTLLFLQAHLKRPEQGRLMRTCIALARRLNPDVDILLIDNASLLEPLEFMALNPGDQWKELPLGPMGEYEHLLTGHLTIARFAESIGHFHYDRHNAVPPKDGPMRAMMTAMKIAAASGYDRAAYMESDSLMALPLQWGWDRLTKPCGAMPRIEYGYLDWQTWWMADIQWLVNDFDFPARYDWPNQKPDWMGSPVGELQIETILGPHVEILPVRGGRGDAMNLQKGTLRQRFPDGIDSLTHADPVDFATFLEMNGHADLIDGLMCPQTSTAGG